ncbi:MAG TPA: MFS transporter [Acidimicrobiales bacterium]|nr:MFS transporter [Acidimicrobiales bacterium]
MRGARPPRPPATTAVFAVAFIVLGLPDFAHGVAWPSLRRELGRPLADLGTYLVVAGVGYLAVALSAGRLARRWAVEGLVLRATLSSAIGLGLVAVAPAWPFVLVGGLLAGSGAGGMDTGFNAAVALRGDGRLMGLLHAGYGVGAAIGPVVVGASLVAGGGWRWPYAVFGLASLLLVAPLWRRSTGDAPAQEPMGRSVRGLLLPCVAFVVYVALEVAVGQWAFTFLTEAKGLGDLAGAVWVAVYWVGLTAGRLWLGLRGHARPAPAVLAASATGATGGTLLLWLGGPVGPVGLLVVGLALSTVFPLLMLLTPARVGPERAAAAIGWQTASACLGGAAGPAAVGVVLDRAGVQAYGPAMVVLALGLAAVIAALRP